MRSGERNSLLLLKAYWVFPTGYFRSLGTKTRNRRLTTSGWTIRPEVIAGCSTLSSNVRLKPQQALILL
jgi:hypothetical protein